MRLAKITQKSGQDVYVNPAQVRTVLHDKTRGETYIYVDDPNKPTITATLLADVVKEIDDAMQ